MSNDPFGVCLEPKCEDVEPPKELPSFTDMAKNFTNTMKDVAMNAFSGKGVMTDEQTYDSRMSICSTCPSFKLDVKRCAECGCFMEVKARFANVSCPINKW
jgi:hypothetical protein